MSVFDDKHVTLLVCDSVVTQLFLGLINVASWLRKRYKLIY